jgi:glycosyltransferase involved in cell wall biosynthesis
MYGEADALLMLSHADNGPLVVLEAMACGIPVVSWDTGGIPELVDEHCGLIVPQGDLQQLLGGLVACDRAGRWLSMGVAARSRVLRLFTRERMAADYAKVYNHLLKGNHQQLA